MKVSVDEEKCIGCGMCEGMCPQCFRVKDGISKVLAEGCEACDVSEVAKSGPTEAIVVEDGSAPKEESRAACGTGKGGGKYTSIRTAFMPWRTG